MNTQLNKVLAFIGSIAGTLVGKGATPTVPVTSGPATAAVAATQPAEMEWQFLTYTME